MIVDLSRFITALEDHTKALLVHAEAVAKSALADVESAVKRPRGRPAKGETAEAAPEPVTNAAAPVTATAAAAPAEEKLPEVKVTASVQQVAKAITDVANSISRDAAVKILNAAGASRVPELKPDKFDAVVKACTDALAAKAAAADSLV